uniref:Uncharacterized protein n=1 Tax=Chromera velia CCMP2878 TaxID=1169474 RepID=A0A0G4G6E8_9ALVE|eukprot:Cvel_20382.t1-p1 / transcript=Cvel_20382.t1 / gene=Cvel_20382 / organism=Chromera_velia_CCMP2878 / gene_product=hypothetical protein / transcript_product=hypothetical protein / location=Cvel_scaffold1824:12595-12909(+) / protein_length=105 / sequence_SO=supercontig / SO=protein_coding / is_pseudo=false
MCASEYRMKLAAKAPDKEGAERARLVQVAAAEVSALRGAIKIPYVSVAVAARWQSIMDSGGYDRPPLATYFTACQALPHSIYMLCTSKMMGWKEKLTVSASGYGG